MKELDCLEILARKSHKNFESYGNELLNYFVPKINNVRALSKLEIILYKILLISSTKI